MFQRIILKYCSDLLPANVWYILFYTSMGVQSHIQFSVAKRDSKRKSWLSPALAIQQVDLCAHALGLPRKLKSAPAGCFLPRAAMRGPSRLLYQLLVFAGRFLLLLGLRPFTLVPLHLHMPFSLGACVCDQVCPMSHFIKIAGIVG